MSGSPAFELSGVGVDAGGRTLLHSLDLCLPAGTVCGLIGHNGSGKTTLLRVLARQHAPSRGRLRLMGRDAAAWSTRDLARQLAYLPQTPPMASGLLVRELVMLGRFPWHGTLGRVSDADRMAVAAAMDRTGVGHLADRQVASLSGGERQCAAIAMCVAQGGRCLLLDEPTAALDIAHQVQVLEVVRALNRTDGIGVVAVLHDINLAARFCDELVALRAGRVIARGTPGDVMRGSVLRDIYGIELGLLPHPAGFPPVAFVP